MLVAGHKVVNLFDIFVRLGILDREQFDELVSWVFELFEWPS